MGTTTRAKGKGAHGFLRRLPLRGGLEAGALEHLVERREILVVVRVGRLAILGVLVEVAPAAEEVVRLAADAGVELEDFFELAGDMVNMRRGSEG